MHRNQLVQRRYGDPAKRSTCKKTAPIGIPLKQKTFEVPIRPKKATIDASMQIDVEPLQIHEQVLQVSITKQIDKAIEKVIAETKFPCPKCPLILSTKFNLNRHDLFMHGDHHPKYLKHIKKDKKLVCKVCQKEYMNNSDLRQHYVTKH